MSGQIKNCTACGDQIMSIGDDGELRCGTCGKYFGSHKKPTFKSSFSQNKNYSEKDIRKRIQEIAARNKRVLQEENLAKEEGNQSEDHRGQKNRSAVKRYSEETFCFFRKTVVLKIENTILLGRKVDPETMEDFLFLMKSPSKENRKAFLRLLGVLSSTKSEFSAEFIGTLNQSSFATVLKSFQNTEEKHLYLDTYLNLLRLVKETNVDLLNCQRKEIKSILAALQDKQNLNEDKVLETEIDPKPKRVEKDENSNYKTNEKNNGSEKTNPQKIKIKETEFNSSTALVEISKKLTETHKELENMTAGFKRQKSACADLTRQLQKAETENKLLEGVKREMNKKLCSLEERLNAEMGEKRLSKERMAVELSSMAARIELIETENKRLREKEKILKDQNINENKIRNDIEAAYEKLKSKSESASTELSDLRRKCDRLARSFEALRRMAKSQLGEAGELYKNQFSKLAAAQKKLSEVNSTEKGVQLKLENAEADLRTQKNLKEQFRRRTETLEKDLQNSTKQQKEVMDALMSAKQKNEELEREILSITQIKSQFMNQLLEKQEQIAKLKENAQNKQDSTEEISTLKSHLETATRENHELKSRLFDEVERNKRTRDENKELLEYLDKLLKERGE